MWGQNPGQLALQLVAISILIAIFFIDKIWIYYP